MTAHGETAFERIRSALETTTGQSGRKAGLGWSFRCPAHQDNNPSLSVTPIEGSVLLFCQAGCDTVDVLASLAMTSRDLYDERSATYRYDDGRVAHRAYDSTGKKTFRQSGNTGAVPTLYHLDRLQAASGGAVYVVEGEKDVHALEAAGQIATTAPMGAANFAKVDVSPLAGRVVIAIVDRDDAGRKWASDVERALTGRVEKLMFAEAKTGKDAADHIAAGYSVPGDLVRIPAPSQAGPDDQDTRDGEEFWAAHTIDGGSFVFDTPDLPPAVWGHGQEVVWAQGEALMICGPSGVGKTTLTVQLVEARLGLGSGTVLGQPVQPGQGRVLYLAMDRPPQVARAMGRVFRKEDRALIAEKLVVWKGPPPHDLAKRPETLLMLCQQAGADTVVIDSLKDGVLKLSEDESGGGYNKARQMALRAGIEVIEQHHQRKAGGDNKKPTRIDDVYGSVWITAGAGSVLVLWGEPGDPVVELIHLKQPAEPWGPWMVLHDHAEGRSELHHPTPDVLTLVRHQSRVGMTPRILAMSLFTTDQPTDNQLQRARTKLGGLVKSGHLVIRKGFGQEANTYFLATPDIDSGERS